MRNFYKFIPMLIGVFLLLGNPLFSSGQTLKSTLDITELPFSENWDADPDPADWTYYTNSAEGTIEVQSAIYYSPGYAVDMDNGTDETSDFFLVLPGTSLSPNGTRLKLFAKHQSTMLNPQSFKVGVMTDPMDAGTYTNIYNSPNLSSDWQEYIIDLSAIPPQGGTYYIAIKGNFDGTNKHIYFDDVMWEETPTEPVFQSTPDAYDYGQIMIDTDSDEVDFVMTNYGISTLSVTDITLSGVDAGDFTVTDISETLPFDLTANSANTITVTVQFSPTTDGAKTASLDVTANTEVNSIPLTGECFDPTIYTLPWSENFDGVTIPELPMGWSSIFSAANDFAYFETAISGFSEPNCLKAYNSSDLDPTMLSITPPTAIDISTTRLQFMAKGPDGILTIGTMTDHTDEATFDSITSIPMTSDWEEYILDFDTVTPIGGTYFIAFRADFDYTYDYVYIDDIIWMEIPTTPVALVNPDTYEFPLFPVGQTTNSGMMFNLRNIGVGALTVTNVSGLDGTEFAFTDIDFDTVAIDELDSRSFGIQYTPTTVGTHTATLSIETNGGTVELDLTAEAYELPEGMIEIGWEQETGQNLPIENFFGYSFSQSLYTQAEINEVNSEITSIFYHKNDTEVWDNIGLIDIYLGHTTQDTISDWIPLSELTHVTFSETLPVSDADGWIEFVLDEPFIYNNVDNLIVAVDENLSGYGSTSDEFYCHNTNNNMSVRYYSDGTNPNPASPPAITSVTGNPGLKKYRPNIRMQFEEVEPTPIAVLDPEIWDAGMRPVGYTAVSDTYTLTNMGSDPLAVSAITDLSGTSFSTSLVAGDVVDLALGMQYEFNFEFTPTAEGTFEEQFIVEVNGVNDTIMLYGTCDYSLPPEIVEVGWGTDTINLPMEPASLYTYSQSIYKQNELDMADQAIYHIYYRQTSETLMNEDIKVYMAHYADGTLDDDWEILGNLTQVYDGTLGSPNAEGWIKISLDFPFIYNNTDNLIVAFDENGENSFEDTDGFFGHSTNENLSRAYTNDYADVDPASVSGGDLLAQRPNIRFEFGPLPTDPYYNLNLDSWDAGMVPGNQAANSGDIFRISNLGAGTLTLTDAVLLDGSVFSTSLVPGDVSLEASEEYYFNFTFAPLAVGTFNDTLVITHADGTDTVFLSGTTDYVLPENMVEIGQGTNTNIPLPMDNLYNYSYSQSIFLQNELQLDGMRISKLYYQKNNANDWVDAGEIRIFMGHTSQSELTDWIPITELQEVDYEEVLPDGGDGNWVEFVLNTPFIYNNTDNLVIAFDENLIGWTGSQDFLVHEVNGVMSIKYDSDGTNPDPANPPAYENLYEYRPNVRLQFEELPTTPIFSVNPDAHDYGTTIIGNDKTKAFTVQNNGIDILTINNIYLGGDDAGEFTLNNLPTFPADLTNDYADAFSIDAVYTPTIEGDVSAKVYFEHSEGIDSVMLYANGYDATITSLPWSEYFDDPATTLYPDMTLGWHTILETTNTNAYLKVYNYTYMTEPYCVRFYNSTDTDPSSEYTLVTPRTQLDPTGTRLRFFADGSLGDQLIVGYMTDTTDATTFVEVETVDLETDYTQHTVDLSSIATAGYYHLAFKANFAGTYHSIYLDNVTWETTPTTPVFNATPTDLDFGDVAMYSISSAQTVEVRNTGVGDLIITDVQIVGAEADQFMLNVIDELNDTITTDYTDFLTVEASINPTYEGIIQADIEFTDIDMNTYTVPLIANSIDATMYPDTLVDFEDAVPPLYWDRYTGLLGETVTLETTTGGWSQSDFLHTGTDSNAAKLNIYGTDRNHWLITSPIDLGDGTTPVMLEFDIALTDWNNPAVPEEAAPDDRFVVVVSTDNGATWSETNAIITFDNTGSEYVFDNLPYDAAEHVEVSLADYSGLVKLGLYGESTIQNADNDLFVDNLEIRYFTLEEMALQDVVENTTMTASPLLTEYEEVNTDEHAIDYTVDYPTPFDANLDALLLHDFQVQFNTMIPSGTTVDVEFDGTNVGQYVADGTDSIFWVSDITAGTAPALNTMDYTVVTLKFNGLTAVNQYDITLHSIAAYDGEFDMLTERTSLVSAMAEINVAPTPAPLPIEEDFDGGIPANWSTNNNGTDGADWMFMDDAALGSTTGANGYMRIDDGTVSGNTNADLITFPIDLSDASGTILLEFEHRYDDISVTTATVYISIDEGATWDEIEQYTGDQGSMTDPVMASIDISDYVGEEHVLIRWNYNDNTLDGLNWNIDDVHIYEFIPNTEAEILTFDIVDQISSTIDTDNATVQVVVPNGTDLTGLVPNFTLSDGAIASIGGTIQESGVSVVDFTNSVSTPVVYTVVAEDNTTTKLWDVTVSTETDLANEGALNFAVYPNPSNGQFDLNVYSENGFAYSIYAVDGKLIHEAQIDATGEVSETINLKDIAPGVYTLKVTANNISKVEKLVIE